MYISMTIRHVEHLSPCLSHASLSLLFLLVVVFTTVTVFYIILKVDKRQCTLIEAHYKDSVQVNFYLSVSPYFLK